MKILQFIACYGNPVITLSAAVFYLYFAGESSDSVELMSDTAAVTYTLMAVIFGLLGVWVFSIGALITLVQPIYGLVKYFTAKKNKDVYLHYFYGFAVAIFSYVIIFSASMG